MADAKVLMLPLDRVRADAGTHGRARLDPAAVADYADEMEGGAEFPPVVVFHDGKHYHLADGFIRYHAARQLGRPHIACAVRPGGARDARLEAASANATHGLRRTHEDKRRAVLLVLQDDEGRTWSAARIAKHCSVSEPLVQAMKLGFERLPPPGRGQLADRSARAPACAADEDDDTADRLLWLKQIKPCLNKLDRKCQLLHVTIGQALNLWRAGGLTLEGLQEAARQAPDPADLVPADLAHTE